MLLISKCYENANADFVFDKKNTMPLKAKVRMNFQSPVRQTEQVEEAPGVNCPLAH
jgi:hypothetical protein